MTDISKEAVELLAAVLPDTNWRAPRNDDWIEWHGGDCPIKSPETKGDVKFRDGDIWDDVVLTERVWGKCPSPKREITRYRITEDHEPKEAPMQTRASLDAEIARLTALRDALPPEPKVVRGYAGINRSGYWAFAGYAGWSNATHYRDFILDADGVPEGFTKIEGGE